MLLHFVVFSLYASLTTAMVVHTRAVDPLSGPNASSSDVFDCSARATATFYTTITIPFTSTVKITAIAEPIAPSTTADQRIDNGSITTGTSLEHFDVKQLAYDPTMTLTTLATITSRSIKYTPVALSSTASMTTTSMLPLNTTTYSTVTSQDSFLPTTITALSPPEDQNLARPSTSDGSLNTTSQSQTSSLSSARSNIFAKALPSPSSIYGSSSLSPPYTYNPATTLSSSISSISTALSADTSTAETSPTTSTGVSAIPSTNTTADLVNHGTTSDMTVSTLQTRPSMSPAALLASTSRTTTSSSKSTSRVTHSSSENAPTESADSVDGAWAFPYPSPRPDSGHQGVQPEAMSDSSSELATSDTNHGGKSADVANKGAKIDKKVKADQKTQADCISPYPGTEGC